MRQLNLQETSQVSGSGYWVHECGLFSCNEYYVYEQVWVPGFWMPEEWIEVCDSYGCTLTYFPQEWISGHYEYI